MARFEPVKIINHPAGWGPPAGLDATEVGRDLDLLSRDFEISTLDSFATGRNIRVCDFTIAGQKWQEMQRNKGKGKKGKTLSSSAKDEEGFSLVDSRPITSMGGKSKGKGGGKSKLKGKGLAINYQEGILGQRQKNAYFASNLNDKGKGKSKGKKGQGKGKNFPTFTEWSVPTKVEWEVKRELQLSALSKLMINAKDVVFEDVVWCGRLHTYNKDIDRTTVKSEKPIRRYEDLNFFNVSTSDDPILPDLLQTDTSITAIATDHVLACLIAATRSVYSWDVVVTKIQGKLIFDKRDGSSIEFLTVNETAREPPNNESPDYMNSPMKLGQEASCINQNFSQMVLDPNVPVEEMERPNPFEEEGEGSAASGAYRYRKIILPGNPKDDVEFNQNPVTLVVRTEVNCKLPGEEGIFATVKALNEFDPKLNYSWRTALEAQRGAVLATELKNNAFKLGRWTAQAILSGCDVIKIGYASRVRPNDPWSHVILGVQTYRTSDFADQIGMTRNSAFGILRNLIDVLMGYEDGKYLIMKDPVKSIMRIYHVPWETFQEEDAEEEEEDEEEEKDLDEDGNVVPHS